MKGTFLWIFLVSITINLQGQFSELSLITTCEICSPTTVHTVDLDGNGTQDILTASNGEGNRQIVWLPNQGMGEFEAPKVIDSGIRASYLSTPDLNLDGNLDIIAITNLGFFWYRNNGDASFSSRRRISNLSFYNKVLAIFDIDGDMDMDMDIVGITLDKNNILWLENDGNGVFEKNHVIVDNELNLDNLVVADLDGDNNLDIISAARNSNEVAWYQNDGVGEFSVKKLIADNITGVIDIFINDMDDDQDNDIIVMYNNRWTGIPDKLSWLENDGSGIFLDEYTIGDEIDNVLTIYSDDLDNDGKNDVIISTKVEHALYAFLNEDEGKSFDKILITDKFEGGNEILIADLTGDGKNDILGLATSTDKLTWYENKGDRKFSEQFFVLNQTTTINDYLFGDLTGDSKLDILIRTRYEIGYFEQLDNQQFSTFRPISNLPFYFEGFLIVDMDTDGDLDIVVQNTARGDVFLPNLSEVFWYENDSIGNFYPPQIISDDLSSSSVSDIIALDYDKDGDSDLILYEEEYAYGKLLWLENNGIGEFSVIELAQNNSTTIQQLKAEDLDNDNDIDFMVLDNKDTLKAFINNDENEFSFIELYDSILIKKLSIKVEDLNNDGFPDVLANNTKSILWLENNKQLGFKEKNLLNDPKANFVDFTVADVDGDGFKDILANGGQSIIIYKNDGNYNFNQFNSFPSSLTINRLESLDLDGNGDIDILGIARRGEDLFYHENLFNYPVISGITYWDMNENGLRDTGEIILTNIPVSLSPNALSSFTDEQGVFRYYVANNTSYTLTVGVDSCWEIGNGVDSYEITLDGSITSGINFGFKLVDDTRKVVPRINSPRTRCGFEVPFTLSIKNEGCLVTNGKVAFVLNSLINVLSFSTPPLETIGDTLIWEFQDLNPSASQNFLINCQIPGPEFIGEIINLQAFSYIENDQGALELSSTYDYKSEIRCAYDPNDKLVQPNRSFEYDQNYTLFEETFEYTVRFQNTGNDTAFNVLIRDNLDKNLDWTTFKPIIGSHPFETLLYKDGLVEFSFKNILLPDSTTNEPLSHGFITYKIAPKKGLAENTLIENTAGIYFDFNPPIITNTTQSVMVSELPKTTSVKELVNQQVIKVYPNPFRDYLTFEYLDLNRKSLPTIRLFDVTGKLIHQQIMDEINFEMPIPAIPNGLYFYQLVGRNGEMLGRGKVVRSTVF